jgi:hypothetical protein
MDIESRPLRPQNNRRRHEIYSQGNLLHFSLLDRSRRNRSKVENRTAEHDFETQDDLAYSIVLSGRIFWIFPDVPML